MPDYIVKADVDTMLRADNKSAIRSAIGVGTTDAPTFLAQTLTGQSLTGTQATSLLDLAATYNTTGIPTSIKLNITETGSGSPATSKMLDLQINNTSQFSVGKGFITFANTSSPLPASGYCMGVVGDQYMLIRTGSSANQFTFSNTGLSLDNAGFGLFFNGSGVNSVKLFWDAPGILAQRNGVNAQAFRVANSVGASPLVDYDRGVFDFKTTTNTLRIGTENGGTYTTARPIDFVTGGVVRMSIGATGNTTFAGSVSITTVSAFSSPSGFIVSTLNANGFQTQGGGYMIHTAAHKLRLSGNGDTTGGSLLLDTVDIIQVRNLANTAPGFIQGKLRTETAYTATVVVPTGFLTLYDSTGTAYRVPCVV